MMPDFRMLIGRGFEKTGAFIHKSDDNSFFAAIDFKTLQKAGAAEVTHWENVLREYLNFYSEQLFRTMKGQMDLAEVGEVIRSAWEMRGRSAFVFMTEDHPRTVTGSRSLKFLAGVGHVRATSDEELLPSDIEGLVMPRNQMKGLEIGRLCLCPDIHVSEKKGVIHDLLKLYVPVLSRDLDFRAMSLRTSKRHRRYYQDVFSAYLHRNKEFFLAGDRDVILQIDPETLRPHRSLRVEAVGRPLSLSESFSPDAA
jgi:hypothetical protein